MKKQEKENSILLKCISIIIAIAVLYNIIFLLNISIFQNNYLKLFGITFFSMKDDLMENDIGKNDLVIVKDVKMKELRENDIIAYTVNNDIRINKIASFAGEKIVTKSNKSYYHDIEKITANEIIGKRVMNLPFLGILLEILQSPITSIFIFVFLIFMLFYNQKMYNKKIERFNKKRNLEIYFK